MKKSTKLICLKVGMIASGIIAIIIAMDDFIMKQFIKLALKIIISENEAASVGIIGGADGPTAIFLSVQQSFFNKYIWILFFLVIAGTCFILWKKVDRSQ